MQISPEIGSVSSAAHSIVAGAAVGFLVQQIGSRTGPGPPPLFFGEERGIKKKEEKKEKNQTKTRALCLSLQPCLSSAQPREKPVTAPSSVPAFDMGRCVRACVAAYASKSR